MRPICWWNRHVQNHRCGDWLLYRGSSGATPQKGHLRRRLEFVFHVAGTAVFCQPSVLGASPVPRCGESAALPTELSDFQAGHGASIESVRVRIEENGRAASLRQLDRLH